VDEIVRTCNGTEPGRTLQAMTRGKPPLLVIAGPTGVGKTAAAVALACRLPIEVISADSRQVYRGMDVATGKPSRAEQRAVAHHLIDVVDPDDRYHAARFRAEAERAIEAIRGRGRLPVVVGGTGLYVRALLRGLDPAPPADPEFRLELAGIAARAGRATLHAQLAAAEPTLARRLHPNDEVRVVRALERLRSGSAVGEAQVRWRGIDTPWRVIYVGLTLDRPALNRRLAARASAMVEAGLLEEVRGLLGRGYAPTLPALQGIGYRQFVEVVRGALEPTRALELMQRDTARYAKRQMTWFAREPAIEWIDVAAAGDAEGVAASIEARLKAGESEGEGGIE
jgi:tRNA dimethylallyltransferase